MGGGGEDWQSRQEKMSPDEREEDGKGENSDYITYVERGVRERTNICSVGPSLEKNC